MPAMADVTTDTRCRLAAVACIAWLLALGCAGTRGGDASSEATQARTGDRSSSPAARDRIEELLGRMTLEEKLGQLSQLRGVNLPLEDSVRAQIREGQIGSFIGVTGAALTRQLQTIAVEQSRLRIPLLFADDVIHGYRTTFPVPLAEASSFEPGAGRARGARGRHRGGRGRAALDLRADGRRRARRALGPHRRGRRARTRTWARSMAAARVRGFQGKDAGRA